MKMKLVYFDTTKSDNILQYWERQIIMFHGDHFGVAVLVAIVGLPTTYVLNCNL